MGSMDDKIGREELLEILRNRGSTYAFLSQMYREEISSSSLSELVSSLASGTEQEDVSNDGQKLLKQFAKRAQNSDLGKVRTELAAEYAGLFLSAGRHPVFPYESVYTSEERLLMQEARDEVLSEYRKEGLDRIKEFTEPEDHIAIELEFMSYLCQRTVEAMEKGNKEGSLAHLKKQKDFLGKHLMVWVPDFCEDLEQATGSDFYKGIAGITKDYLNLEQETIGELIAEVQG